MIEQDNRPFLAGAGQFSLPINTEQLADYKIPRQIFAIDSLQRAANGKPDYPFVQSFAESQLDALG